MRRRWEAEGRARESVRLVAVSKTKTAAEVLECYERGQRVFGENYAQELIEKAPKLPSDVRWHFIGRLQSNKCRALLQAVPNLAMVETLHSEKLARELNKALASGAASVVVPLPVMIQVNTSGQDSKSGVEPRLCPALAKAVAASCPLLRLAGLMTIGLPDAPADQPDFRALRACREEVERELGLPKESLELSMGMSADFEEAISFGSTNIRVGSTIFGSRSHP